MVRQQPRGQLHPLQVQGVPCLPVPVATAADAVAAGLAATLGGRGLEARRQREGSETRLLEELKITVPQSSSAEDPKAARLAELDVAEQGEEEREIWAKS